MRRYRIAYFLSWNETQIDTLSVEFQHFSPSITLSSGFLEWRAQIPAHGIPTITRVDCASRTSRPPSPEAPFWSCSPTEVSASDCQSAPASSPSTGLWASPRPSPGFCTCVQSLMQRWQHFGPFPYSFHWACTIGSVCDQKRCTALYKVSASHIFARWTAGRRDLSLVTAFVLIYTR